MKRNNALYRIRKLFPKVKVVTDATEPIVVNVTREDGNKSKMKNHEECALATACIREKIADHAIISVGFSYLIKNNVATRYRTSPGVAREITSYDRHKDFAPGNDYLLAAVPPTMRLGQGRFKPKTRGPKTAKSNWPRRVHHTDNIRKLRPLDA